MKRFIIKENDDLMGYKWAKEVVNGDFVANKWVKLECERYIERLETKQYDPNFKFEFNYKEAQIVMNLLSLVNYSTGFRVGEPISDHLAGFQAMIIENIFCWFDKNEDENGLKKRMIEEVYLQVGRKSGKSFLCALLEILIMLRSPRFAQHAIAGKTRDISSIVKRETEQLIKASPLIAKYFKITREKITCTINESFMKALSGEANNINGLLLSSFIVDEVANQESQDVIGALKLSQMNTKERLSIYISTAYDLEVNAFRELCDYHKRILALQGDTTNTFGLIFEIDEKDDFTDEKNWIKASPLQMTFENGRDFLRQEFKKGLDVPSSMREFRVKILNEYISGGDAEQYVDLIELQKCKREDDFEWRGHDVYIGVDLSQSSDNCGVSISTYLPNEDKIVARSWAFLPEDKVNVKTKIEKVDYRLMAEQGYCFPCGDNIIDYGFIEKFVSELTYEYGVNVLGIAYDRYNAISSVNKWHNEGLETIEVPQRALNLHPATKWLKEMILKRNFEYDKNRLLEINFANAREMKDNNLNTYINKKRSKGKVDMVASLINSIALWELDMKQNKITIYGTDERPDAFLII